ncbi:hypothetical protein ONE63_007282 [Megalurothrips usitatus]|uniref:Uncharacterized protein n=1 Tax=Megalurothrips usitatus TaxID=439358 RepID=A0AAV7XYJ2_9NEOP|nr:hypothetical protein ONE63_007282 [Megalurothrips usitatus]
MELAIPGPPSLPFLGNALSFLNVKDDLLERLFQLWGRQQHLSRFSLCGHLLVFVSDPADIEQLIRCKATQNKARTFYDNLEYFTHDGLVTLNGAKWRAHRRAIQPAFYQDILDKYCAAYVARIRGGAAAQDIGEGLRLAVASAFLRTTLTLDKDDEEQARQFDRLLPLLMSALKVVPSAVMRRTVMPWLWPDWLFSRTASGRLLRRLRELIDAECDIGLQRIHRQQAAGDLFFRKGRTLFEILQDSSAAGALTDEDIRNELTILTAAGVETTSASLSWTLKVLSVRPDVQQRLLLEAKEVLGESKTVSAHHIARLQYTGRVIKESLRLLPSVPIIARTNRKETVFGGHAIPQGSTFLVNMNGAHRDPRHWQEPLRFDPDRFLPERSAGRHPYAYVPFSVGSRNCVGTKYAVAVMKTLLVNVVLAFNVDPVDDGLTDPGQFPMTFDVASRMPGPTRVVFRARALENDYQHGSVQNKA